MPHPPNYDNDFVQIRLKSDIHQELREVSERVYGSEEVPWSVVVSDALEALEEQQNNEQNDIFA